MNRLLPTLGNKASTLACSCVTPSKSSMLSPLVISSIKIISESALAAGIRRLVAISGDAIPLLLSRHEHTLSEIRSELKCSEEEILTRLQCLVSDKKNFERENKELKQSSLTDTVDELVADAEDLGDLRLVVQKVDDPGDLKELGDQFRQAFKSCGVSLIGTIQREKCRPGRENDSYLPDYCLELSILWSRF